jgi:hypothetical protein
MLRDVLGGVRRSGPTAAMTATRRNRTTVRHIRRTAIAPTAIDQTTKEGCSVRRFYDHGEGDRFRIRAKEGHSKVIAATILVPRDSHR